jgi:hypothetical protein
MTGAEKHVAAWWAFVAPGAMRRETGLQRVVKQKMVPEGTGLIGQIY